jgi:thioredoxin reductase
MVIIGGGAAGYAAAEMLRREGYGGQVTIISADNAPPYDRPNLSKDYLAGTAPEDWIPLRPKEFYAEAEIDLHLGATATAIDIAARCVVFGRGEAVGFDKLLLATGAEPLRLQLPGAELPHVRTLRSLSDSRELVARAKSGARAVIVGASFIGLEVAAALRHRDVAVHVVAPEQRPMERVLGPVLSDFVRSLHEAHGVVFHLGHTVAGIEAQKIKLNDGTALEADLVIVASAYGLGLISPRKPDWRSIAGCWSTSIWKPASRASLQQEILLAGRIPIPVSGCESNTGSWLRDRGKRLRGTCSGAANRIPTATPFFWSQHYDISIDYVGHAAEWDDIVQHGDPAAHDVALRFRKDGRTLALATIFRGQESLAAELAMEQGQSP